MKWIYIGLMISLSFFHISFVSLEQPQAQFSLSDSQQDSTTSVFKNFEAKIKGGTIILLEWTTQFEKNTTYFFIERSHNGQIYESIGSIGASKNSHIPITYSFSDLKPLPGLSYYRVKVVTPAGKAYYSESKEVSFNPEDDGIKLISAYPNPFKDSIKISYTCNRDLPITMEYFKDDGKVIVSELIQSKEGENTIYLKPDSLPNGRYILGIMGPEKKLKAIEILKK
ncbi:MAG: T9SS type A sorting domain-containing protein [Bacteroidota bacterium]